MSGNPGHRWIDGPRLRALCGAVAVAGLVATGGADAADAPGQFRIVFQGTGHAVSTSPAALRDSTVFTTDVRWKLVYLLRARAQCTAAATVPCVRLTSVQGSTISGRSVGVEGPAGNPIDEGCSRLALSLGRRTASADGTAAAGASSTRVVVLAGKKTGKVTVGRHQAYPVTLGSPGAGSGALSITPDGCPSPFPAYLSRPSACKPNARSVRITIDPIYARQSWKFSETCNRRSAGESASWAGTVTVTRAS